MNDVMQHLWQLQTLEFSSDDMAAPSPEIESLRDKIPPQVLGHYERLRARGKKGVALVQNGVCTGCHMRLPTGVVATLYQEKDIQLCDNCGRYLKLASEAAPVAPPVAKKTTTRKSRVKLAAHAE